MIKSFIALCIFVQNTESGDKIEHITLREDGETDVEAALTLHNKNKHLCEFEVVEIKECESEPEPALYAGFDEWLDATNSDAGSPFENE